ncbi:MAG: hypothetical protein E7671_03360 [Ruminococcaceae bacterium]|nr:hypothetical protein [Oscillospiraceae bacterium]
MKRKTAVCDSRIPSEALTTLEKYCDRVILLPPFEALDVPVSAHPDMLIFPCPELSVILTHKNYKSTVEKLFGGTEMTIEEIDEAVSSKYPSDILLNAAPIGKYLFGRLPYLSRKLLSLSDKLGFERIDTLQGYARCSVCIVADDAIITADPSIAPLAKKCGIDVLEILSGGIALDGYNCGFIGGASGNDGEHVFFCGDILSHPDGEKIKEFCIHHGKTPVSLSSSPLYDVGTIFFI